MYEKFYGLKSKPFSLLPDPAYLFMSRQHEVTMSILEYAVSNDQALSVVTGEVGSGKTTLVRQLLELLGDSISVGLISNTHPAHNNLMQSVALAFELPFKGKEQLELYQDFSEFLIGEYAASRRTLLIVDEAQNLNTETLEEIRLLTNINADDHTVLQVLLVGQPELRDLLKRHDLRQLAQRIGVIAHLEPMNEKETVSYIRHRITVAGGDPKIFHKNALRLIHWNSGGVPRVINTLCELALVYGYADRKRKIDSTLVADISRDRIDTGLYGSEVFDLKSLQDADLARRESTSKSSARPAPASVEEVDLAEIAAFASSQENKVFDLVVDGTIAPDDDGKHRKSQA